MKTKPTIHGLISILLIIDTLVVATFAIAEQSVFMAFSYPVLVIVSFSVISVIYCSKCRCRANCNHLIIGKLSELLSKPKTGDYTVNDWLLGVIIPFLPVIIIPQFYIYQNVIFSLLFWLLFLISSVEVYFFVCKKCANTKCSLCRSKIGLVKGLNNA